MEALYRPVWTCRSCLQLQRHRAVATTLRDDKRRKRAFVASTKRLSQQDSTSAKNEPAAERQEEKEQGVFSRRLTEMAEETMDTGSKHDRKLMSQAGFSEDLKKQLEERIAQSEFREANTQAFAEVNMPAAAGRGTREQAAAQPWTGTESLGDSALRMLNDSHKKIRTPARIPRPATNVRPVTKPKNVSAADRLASAREKTSIYAQSQSSGMNEEEKAKMRQELKERFTPGARPMPTTLQGLTSLANERIEDAIARGQFQNIQRGKGVNTERDYAANSPFLDTTEYFMNKLIQRQEIVPPWIEKQQELIKMVSTFRARLRNDWRRHAARSIASEGGTVEQQVLRARSYALTEEQVNPRINKTDSMSTIDPTGNLSTIIIEEKPATSVQNDNEQPEVTIKVTETSLEDTSPPNSSPSPTDSIEEPPAKSTSERRPHARVLPMPYPFRDPEWERAESAYHTLAIAEINALARSYNLMAPKVAQKPYHMLSRELKRCYSEVAPQLADEILDRSRKPKVRVEVLGHKEGSVLAKFQGSGHVSKVRDEDSAKGYGFRQFWNDLFRKDERIGHRRGSML